MEHATPFFTNDAVVFGLLAVILALVFKTSQSSNPALKKFYKYVPALLLCYFIPSLLGSFGLVSAHDSKLYFVASRYLLPTSLVLLTLSVDLKAIWALGPKALIMFFTATFGIVIGGPIALLIIAAVAPDIIGVAGVDTLWRGMATIAGSWIGGGANMTAMKEIFEVGDELFSAMVTVDVLVGSIWMAVLLYGAGESEAVDRKFKADTSAIDSLKKKMTQFREQNERVPLFADIMTLLAVGFGVTAVAHFGSDLIAPWFKENAPHLARFSLTSGFFWLIVIATTGGLLLSFTKAKKLEGVGASRMGSACLYFLIATIGMHMDIFAIFRNPGLFLLGAIWISIHAGLLLLVAKLIKAPFFFTAVGSQANIGGAASAPIVASAFHPTLASVGVMLAVFGYILGTYAAWFCAQLMRMASGA